MIKKDGSPTKNRISFVASTESQDRYGDVINQRGWDLSAYNRNPVVLFNHQAGTLPIGKGSVKIDNDQLMIDIEFDQEDELAQRIESKARNGYMNAVSVGFNPIESSNRSELPKDHPAYSIKSGQYFNKSELLEVSMVTIPANSEATTMAAKNIQQIDRITLRHLITQELKHILEVERMEDGRFRIIFASEETEEEPEEEEEIEIEEEIEEERSVHDTDDEKDDEEEKEDKGFLTASEKELIRFILQK